MTRPRQRARRVTVVIPTLNRCDLLKTCLESLRSQTVRDVEILVMDDGSSEDIAGYLRANFPEARCLRREFNGGFASAANAGIAASATEYVFLLNNDMTLAPDTVARLVEALDDDGGNLAAAGPILLCADAPDYVYAAGDQLSTGGRPESIGHGQPRANLLPRLRPFGLSAGAALFRRSAFEQIGLFDARFVAYYEDADWNFRARLAGFEFRLVPEATVWHAGSASLGGRHLWRAEQCYRNHALLVAKNMPAALLMRNGPAIVRERVHQMRRLIGVARCDLGLARALIRWAKAWCSTMALLPYAIAERRWIQAAVVADMDDLAELVKQGGTARDATAAVLPGDASINDGKRFVGADVSNETRVADVS